MLWGVLVYVRGVFMSLGRNVEYGGLFSGEE